MFPQARSFHRAVRRTLGSLVCPGRRCVSRIIWTNGGQHRSWSAEYCLHSRREWQPQELFRPMLNSARLARVGARGWPIRFEELSRVKKPSRKAEPEAWQAHKGAIQQCNLSRSSMAMMGDFSAYAADQAVRPIKVPASRGAARASKRVRGYYGPEDFSGLGRRDGLGSSFPLVRGNAGRKRTFRSRAPCLPAA